MSARTSLAKLGLLAAGLVSVVAIAPGCGRGVGSFLGPNQPPEIEIVDARGDRVGGAGVRVRWAARDPDGRVVQSRWRMDAWNVRPTADAGVHATAIEECLVPAADLASARAASTGAREPQRFTLWAIDDRGARSEPATLAIFGNNIAPTVMITSPQPSALLRAQVGSDLCIAWAGIDPDGVITQRPVKYKFLLLDLDDPNNTVFLSNPDSLRKHAVETSWAGWDSTSADTEFAHFQNLTPNKSYLFTVTGWDEAGDYDPIFDLNKNMLQFTVNLPQVIGPRITVTTTSFRFQYQSAVGFDDPGTVLQTEVAAGSSLPFDWTAVALPGQTITGYRWVLDPVDPRDETPRSGPDDVRHWSDWTMTPSVALGPFSPLGFKREEHLVYLEARSSTGACAGGGATDFPSVAPVHFVVVKPTFQKDLLVVDDTRLEADKYSGTCPLTYTTKWPSAAELDTFLYARGGVPWRCTKNPPSGVTSIPGILAGYAFDTLGTRGVLSGPLFPNGLPPGQSYTIPLSVLAGYRHVLWLTDVQSALNTNEIHDAINPTTALRFMSEGGRVNVLSAYLKMGGQLWLAGGGTATASLLPWDRKSNNSGGLTVFSSLPQFGEIFPGGMVWEAVHVRSEISVTTALQAGRALGRFESAPGAYGALPLALESRTAATDPLPPTRLSSQGSLFYVSTRQTEFITQPNSILEDVDPDPGVVDEESVLDSLYVVQGSSVPIGTGNVAMTVYHGADNARCIWTGFDLWSFQRSECIALVDGVLQGIWGLSRAPVARGPAAAPGFAAAPPAFSRSGLRPRAVR